MIHRMKVRFFGSPPPPARALAVGTGSLFLAALVGCSGVQRTPDVTPPPVPEPWESGEAIQDGVIHEVQPGQTLWRIARAYEIDLDELARANNIDDPTVLAVGQRLLIPGAAAPIDVELYRRVAVGKSPAFIWPLVDGQVLAYFGEARRTHRHQGLDIDGHRGEHVRASAAGRVVYSGATMRGYGKAVIVDHGDGFESLYAHNSKLLVQIGDQVDGGQTIALVGDSGNASTEHCHFEIRLRQVPVDPLEYLARGRTR